MALALLLAACAGDRAREEREDPEKPEDPEAAPELPAPEYADPGVEARYQMALDLAGKDSPESRTKLHELLLSSDPLLRNAAARALCDLGEEGAAAEALVRNLDRDARTFVCADAIWHLEQAFGTTRGYDPNLGYRHQTERQAEWWAWLEREPPAPAEPDPLAEARRESIRASVRYFEEASRVQGWKHRDETLRSTWEKLAEIAESRELEDVALRAESFGVLAGLVPENADLWNNHALASLQNGDFEAAERSYRKALELAPEDPQLHNDLGILLEGLGRLDEAEQAYREACRRKPKDDVAWANLGDVLRKLGRKDEALAAYGEAEKLAPAKWYYHRLWMGRG
jgi:tetratricopeptide (TPR) repeat protein